MLEPGTEGFMEVTVTDEMSALSMGSGQLKVLSTPSVIALAEETAWRSVAEGLEEGRGTVGTKLDIAHIAATPIGMKIRCKSRLTEVDGRRLVFEILVYDEAEKIAEGTHERFVVDNERFLAKADAKKA